MNYEIDSRYSELYELRKKKIREIFSIKKDLVGMYEQIYAPIGSEIQGLFSDVGEKISFDVEIQLNDHKLGDNLLSYINQRYGGVFKGRTDSAIKMSKFIEETDFNNIDSICEFIEKVMEVVSVDIDSSSKKVTDKEKFYDLLYSLNYIGIEFKLKMDGRSLLELSPGERGIVLLVFYLALSKEEIPIIIDQPEDNLDNQSVFDNLVPCILKAKKKRQVIIVTHNPNIAVACDAEQIIFCNMDKSNHTINYESGAIEDEAIRNHVINVLEGTIPAFDLRKRKYFSYK